MFAVSKLAMPITKLVKPKILNAKSNFKKANNNTKMLKHINT
jgi:hypothetical protein